MKQITQAVFNGQPECMKWAVVNESGAVWVTSKKPRLGPSKIDGLQCFYTQGIVESAYIGDGYDAADWQNSLIRRDQLQVAS
jgi:hypothetical protein